MNKVYLDKILTIYKGNNDLIRRSFGNVHIIFFESLCDSLSIYEYIIKNIVKNKSFENIENLITSPKLLKVKQFEEITNYLENGFCLVFYKNDIYSVEVKANLDRGINMPSTDVSMYGAKDSFCENFQKNLGLLKRKVKTSNLKQINYYIGINTKETVSLIYMDNKCNKSYIKTIRNKLNNLQSDISDQDVLFDLFNKSRLFPTVLKSEKPSICSNFLLSGYVVIMVDNNPFCLILDVPLSLMINHQTHDNFVKFLRIMCLILTILTPAIYLSLIRFHTGLIPTRLLVNLIEQRLSVPFPSLVEALLMLFVCEILRETDIRFPNNYGSASSILGALIIGDAAVNAGIVSPIMIIVIAITFVTSLIFTETKFVASIRLLRIITLLVASFSGLYGISLIFIMILIYLKILDLRKDIYI